MTIMTPHAHVYLRFLFILLLTDMEHTPEAPGAVAMEIDLTTATLPSTHLAIEVDDLGGIFTGPGSQVSGVADVKPDIVLEAGSAASLFYGQVICTEGLTISKWTKEDCPWCLDVDTQGDPVLRRTKIPTSGGKKIMDRSMLLRNYVGGAWKSHDDGFMLASPGT
jgi:hypothetical protein